MREIRLVRTHLTAKIDDEDFELVARHTWYLFRYKRTCYAKAIIDGKWIGMHTFILPPPMNLTVDHKDGKGLNNQKSNLRHADIYQQRQNKSKHLSSTSKYKGVSWNSERQLWVAQLMIKGKQTNLGRFKSEIEAAITYNKAAEKHFGEFAKLNVIEIGGAEIHGINGQVC